MKVALMCGVVLLLSGLRASAASVPFVGCKSDGQMGPREAPTGTSIEAPISVKAAGALAYYKAAQEFGVLAPRGWYCFGAYGSAGETLFLSPEPMDKAGPLSVASAGFIGNAIDVTYFSGGMSAEFGVASVVARVFPAYRTFVARMTKIFDFPVDYFPAGPYPKDRLRYKNQTEVEYTTPARREGLGTQLSLKPNRGPIDGVAILTGKDEFPNLLQVAVRLPAQLTGLTSAIIQQVERDAAPHQLK